MTNSQTVLAHLATRFAVHPENLATEALAFVLASSPCARDAMIAFIASLGFACPKDTYFATQATNDEGSRPDLVGRSAGEVQLFLEAKFWAGLTEAQPNGYLRTLPSAGGMLLFVTPAARTPTVWDELKRRATTFGEKIGAESTVGAASQTLQVGPNVLAITTWRALLENLQAALEGTGDSVRAADVRQLASLCEQMDSDAFLPLRSEELTSPIGLRVIHFGELASDIVNALVAKSLATIKGLRASGGNGWYGRSLILRGHPSSITFNAWRWAQWGESPVWLDVKGPDWKFSPTIKNALIAGNVIFRETADEGCLVPIALTRNVERETVLADAVAQIVALVAHLPPPPTTAPTAPPSSDSDTL